ncbi:hypothetical protein C9374_009036 [Naegleria lovaniensis]|uniref:Uncharacterized protein n=1 Tax=Naegleria lovaniensis TaxID=51637 RepID=A0AA88GI38_NAELO|nr:uncharacterized protein C9374_009036 [Naegleria lovaniensis]KAG2377520.1 hypothetical protein C9374_009036 [Naegleria lovaniensis]
MSISRSSTEPALQPSTPFGWFIKNNFHHEIFCETDNRFTVKEILTQQEKTRGKRVVVETTLITDIDKKRRKVPGCDKECNELALMYQKELFETKVVDVQGISEKADDCFRFHLEQMKKEMDEKITNNKKEYEIQISAVEQECEEKIRSIKKECEIKISAIEQECEEKIRSMKKECEDVIRTNNQECAENFRGVKTECEIQISTMEDLQQNHANEIQELKSDLGV